MQLVHDAPRDPIDFIASWLLAHNPDLGIESAFSHASLNSDGGRSLEQVTTPRQVEVYRVLTSISSVLAVEDTPRAQPELHVQLHPHPLVCVPEHLTPNLIADTAFAVGDVEAAESMPRTSSLPTRSLRASIASYMRETQPKLTAQQLEAALTFRPFPTPKLLLSNAWALFFCVLVQLTVAVPYAANERSTHSTTTSKALRGLITGIAAAYLVGSPIVLFESVIACGIFRWRLLNCFPIAVSIAVGASFVPASLSQHDEFLGFTSICLIACTLTYILSMLLLVRPLYYSNSQKALDMIVGPLFALGFLLYCLFLVAYVKLTSLSAVSSVPAAVACGNTSIVAPMANSVNSVGLVSLFTKLGSFIGTLLPAGSFVIEFAFLFFLKRAFLTRYYFPKNRAIKKYEQDQRERVFGSPPAVYTPPFIGDIEAAFGQLTALAALIIPNAKFAANLVEVMYTPTSRAWVSGIITSMLINILKRSGLWSRISYKLLAPCGWEELATTNALKVMYYRSQTGCGYVTEIVLLFIGTVRAFWFGKYSMVIWLDVNPIISWVLICSVVAGLFEDTAIWAVQRLGWEQFAMPAGFSHDHPLGNTGQRNMYMVELGEPGLDISIDMDELPAPFRGYHRRVESQGYAFVFSVGLSFVLFLFVAFLGPTFVFGVCECFEHDPWSWFHQGEVKCGSLPCCAPVYGYKQDFLQAFRDIFHRSQSQAE